MRPKASNRLSWLEEKWKPILDTFELSTLRRGRTLEKQGQVAQIKVEEGRVTAEIQGSKIRAQSYRCTVSFDCTDWKENAFDDVVKRLYHRPDFLAALFAGEWETDFWNALSNEGIRWFPDAEGAEEWLRSLRCTCNEPYVPCTHAAAAIYALLHRIESHPVGMLRFIGIDDKKLMDAVHQFGVENNLVVHHDTNNLEEESFEAEEKAVQKIVSKDLEQSPSALGEVWMEEMSVFVSKQTDLESVSERLRHRIRPQWDECKLQALEGRLLFRVNRTED